MNTVLSVQGASAPVEKKSFFSKFTCLNMRDKQNSFSVSR